jgi:hypothetical protein
MAAIRRHPAAADEANHRAGAALRGIDAFKEFDKVFIMTGGGPGTVSNCCRFTHTASTSRPGILAMGPRSPSWSISSCSSCARSSTRPSLEVREREGLRHGQILEDPGNRHSCLRAGDSADALCLDGALTSFKGRLDILSPQPTWSFTPTLANYPAVFIDKDYSLLFNSLVICWHDGVDPDRAPAAYVFARSDFAGKEDPVLLF